MSIVEIRKVYILRFHGGIRNTFFLVELTQCASSGLDR